MKLALETPSSKLAAIPVRFQELATGRTVTQASTSLARIRVGELLQIRLQL